MKNAAGVRFVLLLFCLAPLLPLLGAWRQMPEGFGTAHIRATRVNATAEASPGRAEPGPPPASSAAPAAAPPRPAGHAGSARDFGPARAPWEQALASADIEQGRQLAQNGRPQTGVQACASCHALSGAASQGPPFPALIGLAPAYLAKQLDDFRTGARNHPLMSAIARSLAPAEIGNVAAFYGAQHAAAPPPAATPAPQDERARKLDLAGDGPRALPACANCHGPGGRASGPLLPALAGQNATYLAEQMRAFRTGARRNDDSEVMQAFAQRLTEQEIEALSAYYAAQRPRGD